MNDLVPLVVGPFGALVVMLVALWGLGKIALILWRTHEKTDMLRDALLERQMAVNESYAEALPELTDTIKEAMQYLGERRTDDRSVRRDRRTP